MPFYERGEMSTQFNRVVISVPPHVRLAVESTRDQDASVPAGYTRLIEAGLKKLHPEEYKKMKEDWAEHARECLKNGTSSEFYKIPRHLRDVV